MSCSLLFSTRESTGSDSALPGGSVAHKAAANKLVRQRAGTTRVLAKSAIRAMLSMEAIMVERMLKLLVTVSICGAALLLTPPASVTAASQPSLKSAGGRWSSSYAWSKYKANSRSFRYKGVGRRASQSSSASRYSIFSSKTANRGATVGSRLSSSLSAPGRSYGYRGRYSHRQKIVSYHRYKRSGQANRGSTIRVRRK